MSITTAHVTAKLREFCKERPAVATIIFSLLTIEAGLLVTAIVVDLHSRGLAGTPLIVWLLMLVELAALGILWVLGRSKAAQLAVIETLLDGRERYGMEIVRARPDVLKPGTVYVTLAQMEDRGIITSKREPGHETLLTPRRLYRLAKAGRVATRFSESQLDAMAATSLQERGSVDPDVLDMLDALIVDARRRGDSEEAAALDACDAAGNAAGPADDGWNQRYVGALHALGFELVPPSDPRRTIMAPVPLSLGQQYLYPSKIVRRKS